MTAPDGLTAHGGTPARSSGSQAGARAADEDRVTPSTSRTPAWLPSGSTLPQAAWEARHRWLTLLLWASLAASAVLTVAMEHPWYADPLVAWGGYAVLGVVAAAASLPLAGLSPRASRWVRSAATASGLMSVAAIAVALFGGAPEAHFLFFIFIPLVALYEAWLPFLVAIALVVLEHGVVGTLVPSAVFGWQAPTLHHFGGVWHSAAVHGLLFALACAASMIAWRGAEAARAEAAAVVGELQRQTRRDELTGLANRTGLAEGLDLVLRRPSTGPELLATLGAAALVPSSAGLSTRAGEDLPGALVAGTDASVEDVESMPVAVVVMDLNRFKEVNDTLGHSAGDELLRSVATTMRSMVDGVGLLARLGGDEFALLLPGADGQSGTAIAELLRQQLREGAQVAGVDLDLDLSAGVAVHPGGQLLDAAGRARVAEDLLRHADIAMYVAKSSGGGATEFDPALDHHSTARLEITRDLRIAVERDDELLLHFQPKLGADDGRLVGVEALVRWQHPVRGFMPPSDFIPVLERTDLVHAFTDKVLELGLDQARAWLEAGYDVPVAVNVSPRCLTHPEFVTSVAQMLARRSLPAHLLRVEITEDALVADPEAAASVITELRAMGISTSIDDFGTGYSSLSYLRRLPVDEVKLDRAFVTGLGMVAGAVKDGPAAAVGDEVLVSSIIDLAHRLGMKVVAEGVEHAHELLALVSMGCDVTQGYLHGKPVPAAAVPQPLLATARLDGPTAPGRSTQSPAGALSGA